MSAKSRRRRSDRIGRLVAAGPRFWAAMAVLPPYFLTGGLAYEAFLTALFAILAVCAGKRIRWGYFAVLVLSITFFHLLAPKGRVLAELGPFTITAGALEGGLSRGVSLVGMVFLSVAAVRPELELPGRFGGLLGRTFYHFEAILEGKGNIDPKNFFGSLDRLLMERLDPAAPVPGMPGSDGDAGHSDAGGTAGRADIPRPRLGAEPATVSSDPAARGWVPAVLFAVAVWGVWIASVFLPVS